MIATPGLSHLVEFNQLVTTIRSRKNKQGGKNYDKHNKKKKKREEEKKKNRREKEKNIKHNDSFQWLEDGLE